MSWGERSCRFYHCHSSLRPETCKPTYETCRKECDAYEPVLDSIAYIRERNPDSDIPTGESLAAIIAEELKQSAHKGRVM